MSRVIKGEAKFPAPRVLGHKITGVIEEPGLGVAEADAFPLPSELPLKESAILGCAAFTAYGAVCNAADLQAGESAAVLAAGVLAWALWRWPRRLMHSPPSGSMFGRTNFKL